MKSSNKAIYILGLLGVVALVLGSVRWSTGSMVAVHREAPSLASARDSVARCFRIDNANRPPFNHRGVVICGPLETMDPPTVEETNDLAQCLASTGKEFDMGAVAEYEIYLVEDIIGYPMKENRIIIGYADMTGKRIYVRKHLYQFGWLTRTRRLVLRHEIVHAITLEGAHDEGAFDVCSPREFGGSNEYRLH